jgi:hypothetical protein
MPHEEEKNYMLEYEHGNGRSAIGSEYKSGGHNMHRIIKL